MKKKVEVRTKVVHSESIFAQGLAGELPSIAQSGPLTWEMFSKFSDFRRFAADLREFTRQGKLDDHIIMLTGSDGEHFAMIESQGVRLIARLDNKPNARLRSGSQLREGKAAPEKWVENAICSVQSGDYDVGTVRLAAHATMVGGGVLAAFEILKMAPQLLKYTIRVCARFCIELTAAGNASEFQPLLEAAELRTSSETMEAPIELGSGEATAEFTCATAATIGVGLFLVAVGVVLEECLSNVMYHQLRIFNGTSGRLDWEIAYIDTGEFYRYPDIAKKVDCSHKAEESSKKRRKPQAGVGTKGFFEKVQHEIKCVFGMPARTDKLVGQYGDFSSETDSFAEGVGYLIRLDHPRWNHESVFIKIVIPYRYKNRIAILVEGKHTSPKRVWENNRLDRELVAIHRDVHGIQLRLSMDRLEGTARNPIREEQIGYYFSSCLHVDEPGVFDPNRKPSEE